MKPAKHILGGLALAALAGFATPTAHANSLQASPVLIELNGRSPSSAVNVRNTGRTPFEVQTRVFRWIQEGGNERFEETEAVVTSPPITTLDPGATYSVRVLRVDKNQPAKEEAYRVLVDQLPDESRLRSGTVALVMRHSIPVFVTPENAGGPQVRWSLGTEGGRLVLQATNTGGRRLRLSQVSVSLAGGKKVPFGNGLLGYVHAGSTMRWVAPASAGKVGSVASGGTVNVTTDLGTINVKAAGR
ncbi:MAG TPA: molecular chaperone [Rhabdaerophilum sp.]|nr:molecular chaperone [Rhabdaerophilum sp.]